MISLKRPTGGLMGSRKCTATLTLVLISAASLGGCGDDTATRDVYRNIGDCRRDWGDASKCEPVPSGAHAGSFYGPFYGYGTGYSGSTSAARAGSHAVASTTVSRG